MLVYYFDAIFFSFIFMFLPTNVFSYCYVLPYMSLSRLKMHFHGIIKRSPHLHCVHCRLGQWNIQGRPCSSSWSRHQTTNRRRKFPATQAYTYIILHESSSINYDLLICATYQLLQWLHRSYNMQHVEIDKYKEKVKNRILKYMRHVYRTYFDPKCTLNITVRGWNKNKDAYGCVRASASTRRNNRPCSERLSAVYEFAGRKIKKRVKTRLQGEITKSHMEIWRT